MLIQLFHKPDNDPEARSLLRKLAPAGIEHLELEYRYVIQLPEGDWPDLSPLFIRSGEAERNPILSGPVIEIGPRDGWFTPYSTHLCSILNAQGIPAQRVEKFRRLLLFPQKIDEKILDILHDKMTERIGPFQGFQEPAQPAPVRRLFPQANFSTLKQWNEEMGCGLNDQQISTRLYPYCEEEGHLLTDVELFALGANWSDHCCHIVTAHTSYTVDGEEKPRTILGLIKQTLSDKPTVLSAYHDNAAAIEGCLRNILRLRAPDRPSPYILTSEEVGITFKMETHNHPSAIEPYGGSATGIGGVIRDGLAIGRGGWVDASVFIILVSDLFLPELPQPWEHAGPRPLDIQHPRDILIRSILGASDYGNRFGIPLITFAHETLEFGGRYGYHKPVMAAGVLGSARVSDIQKQKPEEGELVVQIGGLAYPIGIGGASASSKGTGDQDIKLDFGSVQRGDGQMENKMARVIKACLRESNPFLAVGDLGAGGNITAPFELCRPLGVFLDIREIPNGDSSQSILQLLGNEAQERCIVRIPKDKLPFVRTIAKRERCPLAVIGTVTNEPYFRAFDQADMSFPVNLPVQLLDNVPEEQVSVSSIPPSPIPLDFSHPVEDVLELVLQLPGVGNKHFLTRHFDRSVGGRVAQQPTVGPLQLPIADMGVLAISPFSHEGSVVAVGKRPFTWILNPESSVQLAITEALLKAVWSQAPFDRLELSGNWMVAIDRPGEAANFYRAAEEASRFCQVIGRSIIVGKDSNHMRVNWDDYCIQSPGTLIASAFGYCPDVNKLTTPDIKQPGNNLAVIRLSQFLHLGGSAFAYATGKTGEHVPVVDPEMVRTLYEILCQLQRENIILSGHTISYSGLLPCMLEMAFAKDCGLHITASSVEWEKEMFAHDPGVVVEYPPEKSDILYQILDEAGLPFKLCGQTTSKKTFLLEGCGHSYHSSIAQLRNLWSQTSKHVDLLTVTPECVEKEYGETHPLCFNILFSQTPTAPSIMVKRDKPKVAVLRDEGTNGDEELATAFYEAGFAISDVVVQDLLEGYCLGEFRGLALPGGFTYADDPSAGTGTAMVLKHSHAWGELQRFYTRKDTFSLGICNGCQIMAQLGVLFPYIRKERQPYLGENDSGVFESRFVPVKICHSSCIFTKGMEGSVLGVWVAHKEGKWIFPEPDLLRYINHRLPIIYNGEYPFNPNGSVRGIAGVCSENGRHLALMPHPERCIYRWQWPYSDCKHSPWLTFFQNARKWCS